MHSHDIKDNVLYALSNKDNCTQRKENRQHNQSYNKKSKKCLQKTFTHHVINIISAFLKNKKVLRAGRILKT